MTSEKGIGYAGPASKDAAHFYAAASGRALVGDIISSPRNIIHTSVIVAEAVLMTPRLLELIYSAPSRSAPGLILAPTSAQLMEVARSTFEASRNTYDHALKACVKLDSIHRPPVVKAVTRSDIDVSMPMHLLWIAGHSDGIDASLPGGAVLCPLPRECLTQESDHYLYCRRAGYCYRAKEDIRSMSVSKTIIRVEDLHARIVVGEVCNGLQVGISPAAYASSLAWSFCRTGRTAAYVAPWSAFITSPYAFALFQDLLLRGMTLGQAVSLFNNSILHSDGARCLAILGDPDVSVPAGIAGPYYSESTVPHGHAAQSTPSGPGLPEEQLQAILAHGATYHHLWLAEAQSPPMQTRSCCFYCESNVFRYSFKHRDDVRLLDICPSCGVIADRLESMPAVRIQRNSESIVLKFDDPNHTTVAAVRVGCKDDRYSRHWIVNIKPAHDALDLGLPEQWPPIPNKVSVVTCNGKGFSVFTRTFS